MGGTEVETSIFDHKVAGSASALPVCVLLNPKVLLVVTSRCLEWHQGVNVLNGTVMHSDLNEGV